MPEPVDAWWARRRWSRGLDVPYPVGAYREAWASFPVLIRQYHPDLNRGITLTQVPPAADVLLTWQCDVGHVFVATPEEQRRRPGRERRRSSWCPDCADAAAPRTRWRARIRCRRPPTPPPVNSWRGCAGRTGWHPPTSAERPSTTQPGTRRPRAPRLEHPLDPGPRRAPIARTTESALSVVRAMGALRGPGSRGCSSLGARGRRVPGCVVDGRSAEVGGCQPVRPAQPRHEFTGGGVGGRRQRIRARQRVRGAAASAQSGHHDERRRSRPGRRRCSSGVATNTCPTSHCQVRSTSAAGGTCVSVMPRLRSGWYCRMSTGNDAHASR